MLRAIAVFIATLLTVGAIKMVAGYYGQDNLLNTFILAILVAQVYEELIDPRKRRHTKSEVHMQKKDIEDLKLEIKFIKYYLHKQDGVDLGELYLESNIWKEMHEEAEENE